MPFDRQYDIFKTYPIRYLGYSAGFSEALFGPVVPPAAYRWIRSITVGFIFGHTLYKPCMVTETTNSPRVIGLAGGDTLLFELVASGFLPPVMGKLLRRASKTLIAKSINIAPFRRWGASVISVLVLSVLCRPADMLVDNAMDVVIRPLYK